MSLQAGPRGLLQTFAAGAYFETRPMIVYTALSLLCFVQYFLTKECPASVFKSTGVFLILLFAAFSGLRGMVGTDTWQYTRIVEALSLGIDISLEPGFVYFSKFFTSLTDNINLAVNLFSVLFFLLAAIYLVRATKSEAIYFLAYFAPQYFIVYSFNGLRIGLASMAFILAIQFWSRKNWLWFCSAILFSISFHYTIVLAITIFFMFAIRFSNIKHLLQRVAIIIFIGVLASYLSEYFIDKAESYSTFERMSELAGLIYVIKIPLLMAFIWQIPLPAQEIKIKFYLSMGLLVGGLVIALQSYAGLRILDILVWLIPLLFVYAVDRDKGVRARFQAGLALVGFVGALAVLRNISGSTATDAASLSPFVPYLFMWE